MRTVDILVAVQALFSDKNNWTGGQLTGVNPGPDGKDNACFCALGGILKEGGCLTQSSWNAARFAPRAEVATDGKIGLVGFYDPESGVFCNASQAAGASRAIIGQLESEGVYVLQTLNATRYLSEAVGTLTNKKYGVAKPIWRANDSLGYEFVMEALALAIRNAKRRHITGDRKKPQASVQAVAQ